MSYYVLNPEGVVTGMSSHDFGLPGEQYVLATESLDQTKKWRYEQGKFVEIIPTQQELEDRAWLDVRRIRSQRLQDSDWTQLPDVPLTTKEAWADYRQALRDITTQPDPLNITWPVPPT